MRPLERVICTAEQMRVWEDETGRKAVVVDGQHELVVGRIVFVAPLPLPRVPVQRAGGDS